jgi:hypothetical protein
VISHLRILETVGARTLLVAIVSVVVTVVFLPFIIFEVYTLWVVSVDARTADVGPFVPRVNLEGDGTATEERTE